jgi:hypothetical protein
VCPDSSPVSDVFYFGLFLESLKELGARQKISSISFSASKTFLASYLVDDYNNGIVELLKGE